MPSTSWRYRAAGPARASLAGARRWSERQGGRRATAGRAGAADRLAAWAAARRDRARPLVWFHAASVGEGLPGGERAARAPAPRAGLPGRLHPLQSVRRAAGAPPRRSTRPTTCPTICPATVERLLDALAPDLLVFAKLDLWPELATRAEAAGADRGAGGGDGEPRQRPAPLARASAARRRATRRCAPAGAIAEADAARLARLGVPPRADPGPGRSAVRQRGRAGRGGVAGRSAARGSAGAPTLVAGSTWPPDEARAPRGIRAACARGVPEARLILVPHEPTRGAPAGARRRAAAAGPPRAGAPQRGDGPAPLLAGGSGRRAGDALRRGDHGVRRRRVRPGRTALGARARGVGRARCASGRGGGRAGTRAAARRRRRRAALPDGSRRAAARLAELVGAVAGG